MSPCWTDVAHSVMAQVLLRKFGPVKFDEFGVGVVPALSPFEFRCKNLYMHILLAGQAVALHLICDTSFRIGAHCRTKK